MCQVYYSHVDTLEVEKNIMSRRDQMLERISIDPQVCFGKPVIRGTRIWVSLILDFLSNGDSIESILKEYPHITREDVLACIAFGAEAASDRFIEVPLSGAP
jgi:uncharacterized protein (DUF433 family)